MKHLVIGASGLIGRYIHEELTMRGEAVVGTFYQEPTAGCIFLDLHNSREVSATIKRLSPDVVYVAGAETNVDKCDEVPESTADINFDGVARVAEAISSHTRLVFMSTGYVFDGKSEFYREEDTPCPINEYGRQKLRAEEYIQRELRVWTILRMVHVYGRDVAGKTFAGRARRAFRRGEKVKASKTEIGSPVHAYDVAQMAIDGPHGIVHVFGPSRSRYEFLVDLAATFGYSQDLIEPCERTGGAPRPRNCSLSSTRMDPIRDGMFRLLGEVGA